MNVEDLSEAPKKLRLLADWFDATDPFRNNEVQIDLRKWAYSIDQLLEQAKEV